MEIDRSNGPTNMPSTPSRCGDLLDGFERADGLALGIMSVSALKCAIVARHAAKAVKAPAVLARGGRSRAGR